MEARAAAVGNGLLSEPMADRLPAARAARLLYLSYDGMTDPLGRSQVLPYLARLAALGHRIRLVSLEKPELLRTGGAAVERICGDAGIGWHPLPYRDRPPILSGWFNVSALRRKAEELLRQEPAGLVHCRSDLAGLAGLELKRRHRLPLLYDMRALWPDERAEGGAWDQSKPLYRALFRHFKAKQRELIAGADAIVTLAEEGRRVLLDMGARAPVTVIPCCADFAHFTIGDAETRRAKRSELGVADDQPLLIHLGSVGCNAMLDEMLDFLAVYRQRYPQAQMLFLAPGGAPAILAAGRDRDLNGALHVRSASREQVPGWLAAADLGLFFVRPVFSKKAASPTKLGEMFATGLPVVTNGGIGDVSAIVAEVGGGVVVDGFEPGAYAAAIAALDQLEADQREIRERARRWFDVEGGVAQYDGIYRRTAASADQAAGAARE